MPKPAVVATEPQAPVVDLPVRTEAENSPVPVTGTLKEMLTMAALEDTPVDPQPKSPEPASEPAPVAGADTESAIERANNALHEKIFGKKRKPAKAQEIPAPAPATELAPTNQPATVPAPTPSPAPAKRAHVKDPATELADRYAKLEEQRLELEKQKLELERQRQQSAPTAAPSSPPALALMSPEEKYEYEVFGKMASIDSKKYGDHQKRFLDSVEAAARYKQEWERKNPNAEFDPNDDEHDAFYSRNTVRYDKLDFKKAEVRLAAGDEKPVVDENTRRELENLKLQNAIRDIQPRAINAFGRSVDGLLTALDPAIADTVRKGGRAALLEKYPDYADDILSATKSINRISDAAFQILETGGLVPPKQGDPVHTLILDIIFQQEPLITAQPKSEQVDSHGRPFATWEQWANMSPAQQAQHWHLGADEVVEIFAQTETDRLKKAMEALERKAEALAKRKGYQPPTNGHQTPAQTPVPSQPTAPSPAISSRSVIDTSANPAPDTSDRFTKTVRGILFKR